MIVLVGAIVLVAPTAVLEGVGVIVPVGEIVGVDETSGVLVKVGLPEPRSVIWVLLTTVSLILVPFASARATLTFWSWIGVVPGPMPVMV